MTWILIFLAQMMVKTLLMIWSNQDMENCEHFVLLFYFQSYIVLHCYICVDTTRWSKACYIWHVLYSSMYGQSTALY